MLYICHLSPGIPDQRFNIEDSEVWMAAEHILCSNMVIDELNIGNYYGMELNILIMMVIVHIPSTRLLFEVAILTTS